MIFKKKDQMKAGYFMIAAGIILIFASFLIVVYNICDSERAGKASDAIADELDRKITDRKDSAAGNIQTGMPVIKTGGHEYIGELLIPSLDMKLPVMKSWSYSHLRLSPCRYSGSYITDDLVICGHNYGRHFSPLKWVKNGAEVYLLVPSGKKIHYTVQSVERLFPTDVEKMVENSGNSNSDKKWDMTLFTCYTGGFTRCAVRCKRAG